MITPAPLYHRHRFPSGIIGHCLWLYFRFNPSYRDVEELMRMRGYSPHLNKAETYGEKPIMNGSSLRNTSRFPNS